jgi:hypothetical protein
MTNKKVILRLPKVFEIIGLEVMELWSIGVLQKIRQQSVIHYSNTPVLLNQLKLRASTTRIKFFWVIDPFNVEMLVRGR